MLSLHDTDIFLPPDQFGLSGHWCHIGEIKDMEFFARLRLEIADPLSDRKGLIVAFYVDEDQQYALGKLAERCKIGSTLFIADHQLHYFLDGTVGFRVEDVRLVKVIPASYKRLLELESLIKAPHDLCQVCSSAPEGEKTLQKCGGCKIATYDCRACQEDDWKKGHKKACKALQGLVALLQMEEAFNAPTTTPLYLEALVVKPTVLVISLGGQETMETTCRLEHHLFAELAKRAKVQHALTAAEVISYLDSGNITAVMIPDAEIVEKKYKNVAKKVEHYVKELGGTAVFCTSFSSFVNKYQFDKFFKEIWGLPWTYSSYFRTTHFLRPTRHPKLRSAKGLPASYSIKALQLSNIQPGDAVYGPNAQSVTQSMVFPSQPVTKLDEAPILYTQVGKGYVGFNGDVNMEQQATPVMLALLGIDKT